MLTLVTGEVVLGLVAFTPPLRLPLVTSVLHPAELRAFPFLSVIRYHTPTELGLFKS